MIAVYTARNSSMQLHQRLNSVRIPSKIVNTPRELSVGCGLSVRFNDGDFHRVKAQVAALSSFSFAGIWREDGGRYVRIY